METSIADMKAIFPFVPKLIQGIPTLESLVELLFHMCQCAQTHRSPASSTMNLLFCVCPFPIYVFFTADVYTDAFAPIPPVAHGVYRTMPIVLTKMTMLQLVQNMPSTRKQGIMNAARLDVFINAVFVNVHTAFQQWRLRKPNIVFVDMFECFAQHYGTTTAEDCNANCQWMADNWHPSKGFDTLALCLFTGTAYTNATGYPIVYHGIFDIGICVIKQCGLYTEEYKSWIAQATANPCIIKMLDAFKTFWADKITCVNQTAIPTSSHGHGMATINNNDIVALYGESIANFGAVCAVTQESVKIQGTTIALMQTQL